jgi:hypothetical protein
MQPALLQQLQARRHGAADLQQLGPVSMRPASDRTAAVATPLPVLRASDWLNKVPSVCACCSADGWAAGSVCCSASSSAPGGVGGLISVLIIMMLSLSCWFGSAAQPPSRPAAPACRGWP